MFYTGRAGINGHTPNHIKDLYTRSQHLNEGEAFPLGELLTEHQTLFAAKKGDLGQTCLTEHQKETGNHPPIKKPARRLPIPQRVVAEAEIASVLTKGVIKPALGPWASPIILVRKNDGIVMFCVD